MMPKTISIKNKIEYTIASSFVVLLFVYSAHSNTTPITIMQMQPMLFMIFIPHSF